MNYRHNPVIKRFLSGWSPLEDVWMCCDTVVPFKHETTEFSVLELIFVSYFELSSRDRLILYLLLFDERIPSCFTYS